MEGCRIDKKAGYLTEKGWIRIREKKNADPQPWPGYELLGRLWLQSILIEKSSSGSL